MTEEEKVCFLFSVIKNFFLLISGMCRFRISHPGKVLMDMILTTIGRNRPRCGHKRWRGMTSFLLAGYSPVYVFQICSVLYVFFTLHSGITQAAPLSGLAGDPARSVLQLDGTSGLNQTREMSHSAGRTILSPTDIDFLTTGDRWCAEDEPPVLLIFVISAAENREQRQTIRESWGSVAKQRLSRTRVIYVVGIPQSHALENPGIMEESLAHGDILQINALDTYNNLSVKSVAMLKWVTLFCPNVKFVVKTDDDTFVNSPLLVSDLSNIVHERFIMGDIIAGAQPIRDKKSKYFTPKSVYSGQTYPNYVSGAAYVISGDIIPSLFEAAKKTSLFWLEDVYVTGLLARKVHAKLIFNGKFAHRDKMLAPCQLKKKIIALHRIKPQEMLNAWKLTNGELGCK